MGDRELDARGLLERSFVAADAALDEELVVDRAGVVAVEAVFVRVIEPLQREILRASRI